MNGDIEELVLSGKLFNPPSRSSSPVRSRSPSPSPANWPEDGADYDYDSDAERRRAFDEQRTAQEQQQNSIGMGPGRTGVKGVIRDRAEAAAIARSNRAREIAELNRAMEKSSLGGKTWGEEEKERVAEQAALEGEVPKILGGGPRRGLFGHLMEVGVRTFVPSIEEPNNIWVVVHIYDPSLDRCAALDETLIRLARNYPSTKFLRVRAGAIGFASSGSTSSSNSLLRAPAFPLTRRPSRQILVPGRYADAAKHGSDSEDSDDEDGNNGGEGWEDDAVDTDVLPTMLVYRGGELVHTWVRVDWEAKTGIEDLLRRYNIISGSSSAFSPLDFNGRIASSDDEFDDGELVFGGSDDDL